MKYAAAFAGVEAEHRPRHRVEVACHPGSALVAGVALTGGRCSARSVWCRLDAGIGLLRSDQVLHDAVQQWRIVNNLGPCSLQLLDNAQDDTTVTRLHRIVPVHPPVVSLESTKQMLGERKLEVRWQGCRDDTEGWQCNCVRLFTGQRIEGVRMRRDAQVDVLLAACRGAWSGNGDVVVLWTEPFVFGRVRHSIFAQHCFDGHALVGAFGVDLLLILIVDIGG